MLDLVTRKMNFAPSSIDESTRSVELIASTGADVARVGMDGPYIERLDVTPAAIDLSRVDGMPLLDSHQKNGLDKQLGVVRSARVENGKLIVRVQISERVQAIWQDIKAGIIRNVSIGYAPIAFVDSVENGKRVRTITKWQWIEVSLLPIGADAGAQTRGFEMTDANTEIPTAVAAGTSSAVDRLPGALPSHRAAATINPEIRALGAEFGLTQATIDGLIDREATVEEARTLALEAVRSHQRPAVRVMSTLDADPATFVTRAGEALYARHAPAHKLSDPAKAFVNMTTLDIARECLRAGGVSTTGWSAQETIQRAQMTTSDFPAIFADTANRSLRVAYEAAPAVLKAVARQTTAKDFRAKQSVQLSEAPTLEKVNEAGEYKHGALAEAAESYKIDTFGKIISLSRKALVNDDLGAFNDLAGKLGTAAGEFESQFFVDLLTSGAGLGPVMSDGKTLFAPEHGNKAAAGAAIAAATTLSAARLAMRKQKGLSGKPINATPKFLLVPPELETLAQQQIATIQPTQAGDVNPFSGNLQLLVEARLTDAFRWYLTADPARLEGLEYAYLQGAEGPQTTQRVGFEVDGIEVKVSLDFGAAFVDWRGWYTNAGH